jgi:hypothetical protein
VFLLFLLLTCSVFLSTGVQPVKAASKPSTPQFTLTYADYSYDIPATYGVDEFTGRTEIKTYERHVDNKTFIFKIKNQPFTSYQDSQGNTIQLCYNLRFKGSYGSEWKYFPYLDGGQGSGRCSAGIFTIYDPILPASNDQYTNLLQDISIFGQNQPSVGDKVDFQVQALTGFVNHAGDGYYSFWGEASDWSSTQTITIGSSSPAITITPAPTQTQTIAPTSVPTPIIPTQTSTPNFTSNATQSVTGNNFTIGVDWQSVVIVVLVVAVGLLVIAVLLQRKGNNVKRVS